MNQSLVQTEALVSASSPVMAISIVLSKYPWRIEPLKLVFWGFAVIGAATNFGALSASSLQNDQNTKSVTSLLLQSSGSLRNIICFYCPLSCLKWIYIIYELKMYAVWWSVNKSIPQGFSMNRVFSHTICQGFVVWTKSLGGEDVVNEEVTLCVPQELTRW